MCRCSNSNRMAASPAASMEMLLPSRSPLLCAAVGICCVCLQAGHAASPQALVMVNDCSRAFSSAGDRSIVAWDLQVRACAAVKVSDL
jgi:hypothetical protein